MFPPGSVAVYYFDGRDTVYWSFGISSIRLSNPSPPKGVLEAIRFFVPLLTFAGLLFAGSVQNAGCGEKHDISLDRVQRGENWQGKWLPGQTRVRFAVRL